MDKKINIGASCTWGQGPDVLVTLDGAPFMCYENPDQKNRAVHGIVRKGSFELTRNEALELAEQLFRAAAACKDLDDSYAEMVEHDMAIHNAEVENMKREAE